MSKDRASHPNFVCIALVGEHDSGLQFFFFFFGSISGKKKKKILGRRLGGPGRQGATVAGVGGWIFYIFFSLPWHRAFSLLPPSFPTPLFFFFSPVFLVLFIKNHGCGWGGFSLVQYMTLDIIFFSAWDGGCLVVLG